MSNLAVWLGTLGSTRLIGAGITIKKEGAVFGPVKKGNSTTGFLKKGTRRAPEKSGKVFNYTDPIKRESIPKKNEIPITGITSQKNYITANAVEAILQGSYRCIALLDIRLTPML